MATGTDMLNLAATRVNERYVNRQVPKDDPNWHGPWDCAEFMSWLVFQVSGRLYGCLDNDADPARADAYTGSWKVDSRRLGNRISVAQAAATAGAVLLRFPPQPGTMGHIAVSDGAGGTIEARGRAYGVVRYTADGRDWDTGVLVPWMTYDPPGAGVAVSPPALLYAAGRPGMDQAVVERIQRALAAAGADPGPIDGELGHLTTSAIAAFQAMRGLTVDGKVGQDTAAALGISLVP
jgi:hypothetical protein